MSELFRIYKRQIIIIGILVISIILLVFTFSSFGKDYVTGIISDLVKSQMNTIDSNYITELEKRDKQIQSLQNRLLASEKLYSDFKKRLGDVEIKIKERKPPVTSSELRDRFIQLGFKPIN